eukprot:266416_1
MAQALPLAEAQQFHLNQQVILSNTDSNWLSKQTTILLNKNAETECHQSKFADISFIIGEDKKEFPAIRGIFAMQCPYWATKLYSEEGMSQRIIEEDTNITETGFKFIREFFYRLEPIMTHENVIDVLYAANKYDLQHLVTDCNSFIDGVYKSTEYATIITHILLFETRAIQLNLNVNHTIRQRFQTWLTVDTSQQIIKSKAFLLAPKEVIIQIIQSDSFSVKEEDIWNGCKAWCTHNSSKMDITWDVLMRDNFVKHVRFGLMPRQFFVQHVYPSNILSIDESMQILSIRCINHRHKVIYEFNTELEIVNQKLKSQFATYKNAQVLQYTLEMSSQWNATDNTYEGLTNNNIHVGVWTDTGNDESKNNEYVVANFCKKQHVVRMDIGGPGSKMGKGGSNSVNQLNGRRVQYED